MILAIDPGPVESGWVLFEESPTGDSGPIVAHGTTRNEQLLTMVFQTEAVLAIEMVASYGMPVGAEVFETVRWIGRFQQASLQPDDVLLVYRLDVKMHLCKTPKAKDANIRQALIDLLGPPGTKKNQGPTYGIAGDAWSALAIAVTAKHQLAAGVS